MGRPYAKELEMIPTVYDWALDTPIDKITEFVKYSKNMPLYVVGSGGSFSSATFASLLHQMTGTISKCITPLEFLGYRHIDRNCSVLIITAGGNNKDILSAFDRAISLGIKNIGIICASSSGRLVKEAEGQDILVHATDIPTGKDGFLATNSMISSMVWLCRAYMNVHVWPFKMLQAKDLYVEWNNEDVGANLTDITPRSTLVCLYDNWGKTAAVDMESKLVEAGLCNVQLADYRNFAHGRHNWLEKNKSVVSVIALVHPDCKKLAEKTLALIPKYAPQARLDTGYEGPIASLALLIQVLHVVNFFGIARGIDPGRPGVAEFGRKIYHLTTPHTLSNTHNDFEKSALSRKFGHVNLNIPETKIRLKRLRNFVTSLSEQKFGAVVFDYDGTICDSKNRFSSPSKEIECLLTTLLKNNIVIGVATGRGKSVRTELQKIIPKKWHSRVRIGYYNGGILGCLDDNSTPNNDEKMDDVLNRFMSQIDYKDMPKDSIVERRPQQISIQTNDLILSKFTHTLNMVAKENKDIKIVESTHSVDVLPIHVSKLNLVSQIQRELQPPLQILCVGDRGEYPGNDFDLLSTKFSLSEDKTSKDLDSCWNTLPFGLCGEDGVLEYFKGAAFYDGYFMLRVGEGAK